MIRELRQKTVSAASPATLPLSLFSKYVYGVLSIRKQSLTHSMIVCMYGVMNQQSVSDT